jgi:hypothetical protein
MKVMKFETVKRKAIELWHQKCSLSQVPHDDQHIAFYALLDAAYRDRNAFTVLAEWEAEGVKIIEAWDVRMVSKLFEIFPGLCPRGVEKITPAATYDDDGDWVIVWHTG